jgi:hypothetical protein
MHAAYTYLDVLTHGQHSENLLTCSSLTSKQTGADKGINIFNLIWGMMTIIFIIGSTALGGPWPPQANVASDLYPGHPPTNIYNPVSLPLPLPRQNHLDFSYSHPRWLPGYVHNIFLDNSLYSRDDENKHSWPCLLTSSPILCFYFWADFKQ